MMAYYEIRECLLFYSVRLVYVRGVLSRLFTGFRYRVPGYAVALGGFRRVLMSAYPLIVFLVHRLLGMYRGVDFLSYFIRGAGFFVSR